MGYSWAWEQLNHEKTRSRKSRGTVPLKQVRYHLLKCVVFVNLTARNVRMNEKSNLPSHHLHWWRAGEPGREGEGPGLTARARGATRLRHRATAQLTSSI
jgi:hypothetical protein